MNHTRQRLETCRNIFEHPTQGRDLWMGYIAQLGIPLTLNIYGRYHTHRFGVVVFDSPDLTRQYSAYGNSLYETVRDVMLAFVEGELAHVEEEPEARWTPRIVETSPLDGRPDVPRSEVAEEP